MKFLAIFSVLFLCLSVGNATQYQCDVTSANFATDILPGTKSMFTAGYVGKSFLVDSRDGVTRGVFQNDLVKKPTVIFEGDENNSMLVMSTLSPNTDKGSRGVYLFVLRIEVFSKEAEKPFVVMDNGNVYRGTCKRYLPYSN